MLHKLIVEIKRQTISVGNNAFGESEAAQSSQIRRLHTEGVRIPKADLVERVKVDDRQVALGELGFGRPTVGVVCLHFLQCRFADLVAVRVHSEIDVAADQRGYVAIVQRPLYIGVGDIVLSGTQIDVREWRLRHG